MRIAQHPLRVPGRSALAWALAALLLPLLALALYLAAAFAFVLFPTREVAQPSPGRINAFVISNGAHVDLVLPARSATMDWTQAFPLGDFPAPPAAPAYIAIGWGDREFYLHTEHWADITLRRSLTALAGVNGSLLHVSYLPDLHAQMRAYRLDLSEAQYAALVAYVREAMVTTPAGRGVAIPGRHYGRLDAFYEAKGTYNLFNTCNTWIGTALQRAGVPVSRWTPLEPLVVWYLPKAPLTPLDKPGERR